MSVDSVNNNQGNYAAAGAIAGVTTGAVAGGLYGYNSKPWLKDGNLTDEFVRKTDENISKSLKKVIDTYASDMKKLQETGELSSISDSTKSYLKNIDEHILEDLKNCSKEEIKNFAESMLKLSGEKKWEDAANAMKKAFNEVTYDGIKASFEKWNGINIKDDITVDELKKLVRDNKEFLKNELIHEIDAKAIDDTNKSAIIDEINNAKKAAIKPEDYIQETKKEILKFFESDKKTLKAATKDAKDEISHNAIKDTLNQVKRSAALKWAGIGAAAIGAIGLIAGFMIKKSAPIAAEEQHVNTQA